MALKEKQMEFQWMRVFITNHAVFVTLLGLFTIHCSIPQNRPLFTQNVQSFIHILPIVL